MNEPLVSICVITYNSADTIVSTLDSIFDQTYRNIELIISDDCSSDKTVQFATDWINLHKERFINTAIITVEKNSGVTANCNRAYKSAKGKYIKDIGDDILLPDYVKECVSFLEQNTNEQMCFTKIKIHIENDFNSYYKPEFNYNFLRMSSAEQFDYIKKHNLPYLPTPSSFYKKSLFEKINYFDESIPMWEDGPFYFKLAENHFKMNYIDKELVVYIEREKSLSNKVPKCHRKSYSLYYFKYYLKYDFIYHPLKFYYHLLKNLKELLF